MLPANMQPPRILSFIVNGAEVGRNFSTQATAKNYACDKGYRPVHVARQRHLQDRKNPAHWKVAPC